MKIKYSRLSSKFKDKDNYFTTFYVKSNESEDEKFMHFKSKIGFANTAGIREILKIYNKKNLETIDLSYLQEVADDFFKKYEKR